MPVSFSQRGPVKLWSSSAWSPDSLVLVSVMPAYFFAALTAETAMGSPAVALVDASIGSLGLRRGHVERPGGGRRREELGRVDHEVLAAGGLAEDRRIGTVKTLVNSVTHDALTTPF